MSDIRERLRIADSQFAAINDLILDPENEAI
jgi:hypothetical protein